MELSSKDVIITIERRGRHFFKTSQNASNVGERRINPGLPFLKPVLLKQKKKPGFC